MAANFDRLTDQRQRAHLRRWFPCPVPQGLALPDGVAEATYGPALRDETLAAIMCEDSTNTLRLRKTGTAGSASAGPPAKVNRPKAGLLVHDESLSKDLSVLLR